MDVSKITGNVVSSVKNIDMTKPQKLVKAAMENFSSEGDKILQNELDVIASKATLGLANVRIPKSLEDALCMTGYMDKVKFIPDAQNVLPKPMSVADQIAKAFKV